MLNHIRNWMLLSLEKCGGIDYRYPNEPKQFFWERMNIKFQEQTRTIQEKEIILSLLEEAINKIITFTNTLDSDQWNQLKKILIINSINHIIEHLNTIRAWSLFLQAQ
jgi:hypothetical protein